MQCGARAATADPRCSCQRDSPYNLNDDPGAHGNEQGAKQSKMNGGKNVEGSGHDMAKVAAGKQSLQNKAATGKHSRQMVCPAQASKKNNSQQLAGLAAKQQPQMLAGLSPCSAGRWRECGGAGHSERRAQTYSTCLPPTYRLCLSPSLPTPLI